MYFEKKIKKIKQNKRYKRKLIFIYFSLSIKSHKKKNTKDFSTEDYIRRLSFRNIDKANDRSRQKFSITRKAHRAKVKRCATTTSNRYTLIIRNKHAKSYVVTLTRIIRDT